MTGIDAIVVICDANIFSLRRKPKPKPVKNETEKNETADAANDADKKENETTDGEATEEQKEESAEETKEESAQEGKEGGDEL